MKFKNIFKKDKSIKELKEKQKRIEEEKITEIFKENLKTEKTTEDKLRVFTVGVSLLLMANILAISSYVYTNKTKDDLIFDIPLKTIFVSDLGSYNSILMDYKKVINSYLEITDKNQFKEFINKNIPANKEDRLIYINNKEKELVEILKEFYDLGIKDKKIKIIRIDKFSGTEIKIDKSKTSENIGDLYNFTNSKINVLIKSYTNNNFDKTNYYDLTFILDKDLKVIYFKYKLNELVKENISNKNIVKILTVDNYKNYFSSKLRNSIKVKRLLYKKPKSFNIIKWEYKNKKLSVIVKIDDEYWTFFIRNQKISNVFKLEDLSFLKNNNSIIPKD